jgi:hypothetical protein
MVRVPFIAALLLGARLASAQVIELPGSLPAPVQGAPQNAADWERALEIVPHEGWSTLIGLDLFNPSIRGDFIREADHAGLTPKALLDAPSFDRKAVLVQRALGDRMAPLVRRSKFSGIIRRGELDRPLLRAREEIERVRNEWSPATLEEAFSGSKPSKVFNGDAGTGAWQRDVVGSPWLSERPSVVGYDLPDPSDYTTVKVAPHLHWDGIDVVTNTQDPRYPRNRSVDLLHVGFMEMSLDSWRKRIRQYLLAVREGGWALFAHSHAYDRNYYRYSGLREKVRDRLVEETTRSGFWKLHAVFDDGRPPSDYPVTDWWKEFEKDNRRKGHEYIEEGYDLPNFLLLFKRTHQP